MISVIGARNLAAKQERDSGIELDLAGCRGGLGLESFGRVVDAYQARIHGFVLRMVRDEEEALDLTQDVFVRAYQSLSSFDGRCSLRTWLFRIAHNLCVDRHRRKRLRGHERTLAQDPDTLPEEADHRWNPESLAMDDELLACLESAVGELSEKLRSVLVLHDKEGLGYEEIAQAVDVPVGTVKSRLFLARAHLKRRVSEYMGWSLESSR